MTDTVAIFGKAIRQLREQRGWSQEVLAEKADLNRSYVGELERGQAIASLITIKKLAGAMGLSPSDLMRHTERLTQDTLARGIELTAIAC